jgi:hypothetical protein
MAQGESSALATTQPASSDCDERHLRKSSPTTCICFLETLKHFFRLLEGRFLRARQQQRGVSSTRSHTRDH